MKMNDNILAMSHKYNVKKVTYFYYFSIKFGSVFMCNKISKVRNSSVWKVRSLDMLLHINAL